MARPGIMLYFDILEPIRVLPDADKGRLLVAMLIEEIEVERC